MTRSTPHSISPSPAPDVRDREYYRTAKYEKKHKRSSREVIVERIPSSKAWREGDTANTERVRGDEWADPWMRHKSPSGRRRSKHSTSRKSRKQSYSSGSSYSSSRFVPYIVNFFYLIMFDVLFKSWKICNFLLCFELFYNLFYLILNHLNSSVRFWDFMDNFYLNLIH